MKIHELNLTPAKDNKRVGRGIGSGYGKTAGRGTKGQNARTGGGVRPGFEGGQNPLAKRLPKKRGFAPLDRVEYQVVNLSGLETLEANATVTNTLLASAGLVRHADRPVKILGTGSLSKVLSVTVQGASATAKAAIEAAGGSITLSKLPRAINDPEGRRRQAAAAKSQSKTAPPRMNLTTLKQVYRSRDLRRKVLAVLGLLIVYRFLAHVPVPVADNAALAGFLQKLFAQNSLLQFANAFTGSALSNFSIIMMGVGPYINASIIIQLLTHVVPKLEALSKEGEAGRRKITRYTRVLTLPLAILQSVGTLLLVQNSSRAIAGIDLIGRPNPFQWFLLIATITAGSILLMWIGELITERGIGNGISLIIFGGIVAGLPANIGRIGALAQGNSGTLVTLVFFILATLAVIAFIVILNEGQRNIPVSYAKRTRGTRVYAGVDTHLPIRVITAGVIPIIFALAFLSLPGLLGQLFSTAKTPWLASFARTLTQFFSTTGAVYAVSYFLLVVAFTYFWVSVNFNPKDISENLQKQGGFIPGIRPGTQTATYLRNVVNRVTLAGSIGLGTIAVLPFIAENFTKSAVLTLGGTGLLIVVSVALETLKALEAQAITTSYDRY